MGRVEYGSQEVTEQEHKPFISVKLDSGETVTFECKRSFPTNDHAREVVTAMYMILSGNQSNVKYDLKGNS